jgi:hypothetical protein
MGDDQAVHGHLETFEGYPEISGKQSPAGGRETPDGTGSMVGLALVDEVSKNGPADQDKCLIGE